MSQGVVRKLSTLIFVVLVWAGLVVLGFWQLGRYQHKKQWLHRLHESATQRVLGALDLSGEQADIRFRRLRLSGHWQGKKGLLLAGQFRHEAPGYSVITPFQWSQGGAWLLVDRGWVPAVGGRFPPQLSPINRQQLIWGKAYVPSGKRFTMGPWRLNPGKWPAVIQDWDFKRIGIMLGHPVLPFVLRLSPAVSGGYERRWSWVALPPSRHFSYMLQWWGLALVWMIGVILLWRKKG